LQNYNNQSGYLHLVKRERTFILLSASHSMRVPTPTTAISGPVLYVDAGGQLKREIK